MSNKANDQPGLAQRAFVALQYFLPQIAITRAIGWLMTRQQPWLKDAMITSFVRMFRVDLAEIDAQVPQEFDSLNAFFTRRLPPSARPIDASANAIVSPADGVVSACGRIENGRLIQAKGFSYSAAELLQDDALASKMNGGHFATIYLAPYNYHRVHTPIAGRVTAHHHVPGKLFSVNGATARAVPRLFSRNERRVFNIDSASQSISLVMVGALNVGSISTTWSGDVTAGSCDTTTAMPLPETAFDCGDTLGWFNMGSTVILLIPAGGGHWHDELTPGAVVRVGERIGATSAATTA
ncbi:MAG: archaetidylserine decarboxylase [Pseudomonadota bacterium]